METKCGDFWIGKKDLPDNEVGKIMLDIVFCSPDNCRNKEAFLELVEHTAKEIIKFVKSEQGVLNK